MAFEVMIGPGFSSPAFALSPDGVFLAVAGEHVAAFWDEVGAGAAYRGCADLDGDQDVTFVDSPLWRVAREHVAATGVPSCGLGGEAALAPLLGRILGRRRWTGRRP